MKNFFKKFLPLRKLYDFLRDCENRLKSSPKAIFLSHRKVLFAFMAGLLLWEGYAPLAYARIHINLLVVNASEDQTKETPIKYYMPEELTAEDITDVGSFKLDYDVDKGRYYVHGSILLGPKETKTIKITVNDVWRIDPSEVEVLKNKVDQNLFLLEDTPYYDKGKNLRDQMYAQLDYVLAQQMVYADNVERRVEAYQSYVGIFKEIRERAFDPEYLRSGIRVAQKAEKNIKFILEMTNPSTTDEKKVTHKHFLPEEVKVEHIVDSKGFELRFDEEEKKSYLTKEDVLLPLQTKRYEFVIKDIWNMDQEVIDNLKERAEAIFAEIKGAEEAKNAVYLMDMLMEGLAAIERTQLSPQETIDKHIALFRENKNRYVEAQKNFVILEKMLAIVRAKKLEELESGKVTNVLQKLKALSGMASLAQAIFSAKFAVTTAWKIIGGVVVFIAFFTTYHFFLWAQRSKGMGEEHASKPGQDIQQIKTTKEKTV